MEGFFLLLALNLEVCLLAMELAHVLPCAFAVPALTTIFLLFFMPRVHYSMLTFSYSHHSELSRELNIKQWHRVGGECLALGNGTGTRVYDHWNAHENMHRFTRTQQSAVSLCCFMKRQGKTGLRKCTLCMQGIYTKGTKHHNIIWKCWKAALSFCCQGGGKAPPG